jgi:predicted nucleotide-binding protein
VSLAFSEQIFLWIVGKESEQLRQATTYLDLMNNARSNIIPKYVAKTTRAIRSSIIFPVSFTDQGDADGVVNFESTNYLHFNQAIWDELNKISKSIAILYERNQTYQALREDTIRAARALSGYRNVQFSQALPRKKSVFVASSSRADPQVSGKILEILNGYDVDVTCWSDISESGTITQPLFKQIQMSDYGLCYLSEPVLHSADSDQGFQFIDNPNVLFEAGMLSGRSANMENWIPIRERNSDKMPFDLAGVRTLYVPRRQHSSKSILNESEFVQQLTNRLDSLLA